MNHIDTTTENRDQQTLSAVNRIVPNSDGILPSFGQQLDALIKSKRIKNTKLADRTGISANVIAQYRRGKASCSPARAHVLAQHLDCTKAERLNLCRAAALTTDDPVGQCLHALLIERGIQKDSITSVAPSAAGNELTITTRDGSVVTLQYRLRIV